MQASRAASNAQNHSAPRRINLPETNGNHATFRQSQLPTINKTPCGSDTSGLFTDD
jgi:hypothetical protein